MRQWNTLQELPLMVDFTVVSGPVPRTVCVLTQILPEERRSRQMVSERSVSNNHCRPRTSWMWTDCEWVLSEVIRTLSETIIYPTSKPQTCLPNGRWTGWTRVVSFPSMVASSAGCVFTRGAVSGDIWNSTIPQQSCSFQKNIHTSPLFVHLIHAEL